MTNQTPDDEKDTSERPMATGRCPIRERSPTTMAESLRGVQKGDDVRIDVGTDRELEFVTGVEWVEEDEDPYNPAASKTITIAIEAEATLAGTLTDGVEPLLEGDGERVIYTMKEVEGSWTPPILLSWDTEVEAYQELAEVMALSVVA